MFFIFAQALVGYCGKNPLMAASDKKEEPKKITHASCDLNSKSGSNVKGKVTFTQEKDGVRIVAKVTGLTPGKHGFHIHEHGDCSAADASSAGAHYDPTHKKHGGAENPERHVGDLGNIEADKDGVANYNRLDKIIELNGQYSIIGKSVVVHAKEDDLKTQPTGDSGGRIACGVIE